MVIRQETSNPDFIRNCSLSQSTLVGKVKKMLSHTSSWAEVTERASSCELVEMANQAELKRQLLLEIENFQPLSNKLSGYLSNDDLVLVDVDATSARY